MPKSAIEFWQRQRDVWLRRHGIDGSQSNWKKQFRNLNRDIQLQFHREFSDLLELKLDELHGQCVLRRPELAGIVSTALFHFDGERYSMGDFVVMPNHVHLLVCFHDGVQLREQCKSWKHFTARSINRMLGSTGKFWQTESFDHLVRDINHFQRFQKYIADDPRKANLPVGEFVHYSIGTVV